MTQFVAPTDWLAEWHRLHDAWQEAIEEEDSRNVYSRYSAFRDYIRDYLIACNIVLDLDDLPKPTLRKPSKQQEDEYWHYYHRMTEDENEHEAHEFCALQLNMWGYELPQRSYE